MNDNNEIFFNFSYLALKLLGSGMYSNPWSAISELVANGFDAGANDVYIYINRSNKEHSVVEIFDNGSGMSYEDMVNKYVFIGRNKRLDSDYSFNEKHSIMGRKGIGKLAALYLSNNINLISRHDGSELGWNLNISELNESDNPSLKPIDVHSLTLFCKEKWNGCKSGFFIQLLDVNLTSLGEETKNGLINRLSNYYSLNGSDRSIWLSYNSLNDEPDFSRVEKTIAYKNFYALFNNSDVVFEGYENQRVKVKTNYEELKDGYYSIELNLNDYSLLGISTFINNDGEYITKQYELKGWIGIHTSIDLKEARMNDERFIKNRATSPNKLRLYVREKLAVDNFMPYIKNTQAFSNYIEGEISFDILDDDDLPDISTANRQQLDEKDSRVQLLIDLLKPIISRLIQLRVRLRNMINEDENNIKNRIINNLNVQHKKEIDEKDKKISEGEEKLKAREEQVVFLLKGRRKDVIRMEEAIHTINKNSSSISRRLETITNDFVKVQDGKLNKSRWTDHFSKIGIYNQENIEMCKYAFRGKMPLKSKTIEGNIGLFISQYVSEIYSSNTLSVNVEYDKNDQNIKFSITAIGIILENILSNSEKANASNVFISVSRDENNNVLLSFEDDGKGYDKSTFPDPSVFFELGFRHSDKLGSGIGLFHIRELVKKNDGSVYIDNNYENGFRICITIKDGDV